MKRILLVNRNNLDASDGATKSLSNIHKNLPLYGYKTSFHYLKSRRRNILKNKIAFFFKMFFADAVILNSVSVSFDAKIIFVLKVLEKFKKKTFLYVREDHLQFQKYFPELLNQVQQKQMDFLAHKKFIKHWFVSAYSQKSFNDYFKIQTNDFKDTVIYNGIEVEKYKTELKRDSNRDRKIITILGSIQHRKGYHYVIEFAKAMWNFDKEFHIKWYGKGPDQSKFETLIKNENLNEIISIEGFAPLEVVMQTSDAILVCSESESFSRVAIEAMIYRKKLLVRDCLTGTIEITEGACQIVNNDFSEVKMKEYVQYIQNPTSFEKEEALIKKYSMQEHCKRIIDQIEL